MQYKGREIKLNSLEHKLLTRKEYLQQLIDIPYEKWKDFHHWYNDSRPHYISKTKGVYVDIVEGQVIVGGLETDEDFERFGWLFDDWDLD